MRRNILGMADPAPAARRTAPATVALTVAAMVAMLAIGFAIGRGSGDGPAPVNQAAATPEPATLDANRNRRALDRIDALRQQVARSPDDAAAWYELGSLYRDFEQNQGAEQAFRRAMQLQPNDADKVTALGEILLIIGADGSAREADALFRRALTIAPAHIKARYYLATLKDLAGQHREAVDDLVAVLRDGSLDANGDIQVRRTLTEIAQRNRIDLGNRLPPAPQQSAATAAIPGPTREQMDAARGIAPSQQDQMAQGMVERLSTRLRQNPRDERGWMMLMRSRKVLNDDAGARQALVSALAAFSDDAAVQGRLRGAAAQLGIAGG